MTTQPVTNLEQLNRHAHLNYTGITLGIIGCKKNQE